MINILLAEITAKILGQVYTKTLEDGESFF